MPPTDNETWIIEAGERVVERKARVGLGEMTDWEQLVYSLWVVDYGMRNAGDLEAARDLFEDFQSLGLNAARKLSLPRTCGAFALATETLVAQYFELFDGVCVEVRTSQAE